MNDSSDKKGDEQTFWKAMRKDLPVSPSGLSAQHVDLTPDPSEVSEDERERRRRSLLSMLAASQARQEQALRNRLPALTPGLVISVRAGTFANRHGTVRDADYIHGRALLEIDGETEAHWVEFGMLAALTEDQGDSSGKS